MAAQEAVEDALKSWDIQMTEKLLEKLEASRAQRLEKDRLLKQTIEDEYDLVVLASQYCLPLNLDTLD